MPGARDGRVHDLLGQRISLLLRALRDGQQPDEALLMDFARSLPTALREDSTPTPARRLALLRETFQGMDVSVEVRGALPEDQAVADAFAEIAVECVTNAVRHGYATRIQFHLLELYTSPRFRIELSVPKEAERTWLKC